MGLFGVVPVAQEINCISKIYIRSTMLFYTPTMLGFKAIL